MNKYYLTRQLRTLLMLCKLCVLFIFLVLAACGHHDKYVQQLNEANQRQKGDSLFTEVNEMKSLVDYFSRHGSANERMLAHYLLGRAYADSGEAPMAIDCYLKAAECADTTQADCDYRQLSRVYSQMANIYYWQDMYKEQIHYGDIAAQYALIANDTMAYLAILECKVDAFKEQNLQDSALKLTQYIAEQYTKKKDYKNAAITQFESVSILIKQKRLSEAKHHIKEYREFSHYFDSNDDIEAGREIFYSIIGNYYLNSNQMDSAEYYYRKGIKTSIGLQSKSSANYGLMRLYQKKNIQDSVAKYAINCFSLSDSIHIASQAENVERIKSMYNYTHNQKIAQIESDRAKSNATRLKISIAILLLISLIAYLLVSRERKNKIKAYENYYKSMKIIDRTKEELALMRKHEEDFGKIIHEKELQINHNEEMIRLFESKFGKRIPDNEFYMRQLPLYKQLEKKVAKGYAITDEEWTDIESQVKTFMAAFWELLLNHRSQLSDNEYKVCLLTRLGIKPKSISNMLDLSPSSISKIRISLLAKMFGVEGKPGEFDERIKSI